MKPHNGFPVTILGALVLASLTACSGGLAANAEGTDLTTLRQVTAGFDDIDTARAAGYVEQMTPCWYHRDNGGQGYHFARPDLIDGSVSLQQPELVMYEPQANGSLEFLGVEYIVPFTEWLASGPPTLLGRTFMRNEVLEIYVLHVWVGRDNPAGMFSDWNPNVSCANAEDSEDRA